MSARLVSGVFDHEDGLLSASRAVREAGYDIVDAYTPFAVHGLERAMGLRHSRLTWVCFLCGFLGAGLALYFQFWTSATDWPINVGGKPFNSLPAFVPIMFEITVLFAGLGVVAALFIRCGLWPGKREKLAAPGVTDDRFVLAVREGAPVRVATHLRDLLREHGAIEILESIETVEREA